MLETQIDGKVSVKPRLFIDLLILDAINRFIFGHEIRIYNIFGHLFIMYYASAPYVTSF